MHSQKGKAPMNIPTGISTSIYTIKHHKGQSFKNEMKQYLKIKEWDMIQHDDLHLLQQETETVLSYL